jgi:preprotein translocase subunit SecB
MKSKPKPNTTVTVPDLLASLQLDRYLVDELVFKCNEEAVTKNEKPTAPTIAIDFDAKGNTKDKNLFLLEMMVDLNQGQEIKEFETYQIHLHLFGWFRFTTDLDKETKAKMLATNASSMLYGVARSIVANLTGSVGSGRYILPSLNLLAVLKAKMQSKPEVTPALASASDKT